MALVFPGRLPPGALVQHRPPAPAPIWLTARIMDLELSPEDPNRAIGWRACAGPGVSAQAVAANLQGNIFQAGGLHFETEVNGGMVVTDALQDATCLTIGMIFQAGPADARTLLTVQPQAQTGSLFVDAKGNDLRLAQKDSAIVLPLSVQGAADQVTLVLCALQDGRAFLAANGGAAVTANISLATRGPTDLFLGCRGPRAGLRNKLGTFALSDVMIWPGQNLLATPENAALSGAISLWQDRVRHGL